MNKLSINISGCILLASTYVHAELNFCPICPSDMIYVHGQMIDADSDYVESLQNIACTNWIDQHYPARCKSFNRNIWIETSKNLPRKYINFCIDSYEFPNVKGSKPEVFITWLEAQKTCESLNKRLCSEDEWTFACEGEEGMPYPYGYTRDSNICNIDKPWIEVNYHNLISKSLFQLELDRLWQGTKSGEMNNCISPFGVYDMTGNVDEWTVSVKQTGYPSILKGGYWSVVRNRCRANTRSHNQWHKFYQQGFRCCK